MSDAVADLLGEATPTLKELAEQAGVSYAAARYLAKGSPYEIRDTTLDPLLREIEARQERVAQLVASVRAARRASP